MLYIDVDHINRIHSSLYFIFIVFIIGYVSSIILRPLATSDIQYVSKEHTVWIHIAIIAIKHIDSHVAKILIYSHSTLSGPRVHGRIWSKSMCRRRYHIESVELGREYIPAGCSEEMVVQGGISPPDAKTSCKNRTTTINDGYLSDDTS